MTVDVLAIGGEPSSLTCTWRENTGVVSKSRAAALFTVISPVTASIAKALPPLPPTIAKLRVSPTSGSEPVTVPTTVATSEFSATVNGPPLTLGASFTGFTVIDAVATALKSVVSPVVEACTLKLAGPK